MKGTCFRSRMMRFSNPLTSPAGPQVQAGTSKCQPALASLLSMTNLLSYSNKPAATAANFRSPEILCKRDAVTFPDGMSSHHCKANSFAASYRRFQGAIVRFFAGIFALSLLLSGVNGIASAQSTTPGAATLTVIRAGSLVDGDQRCSRKNQLIFGAPRPHRKNR